MPSEALLNSINDYKRLLNENRDQEARELVRQTIDLALQEPEGIPALLQGLEIQAPETDAQVKALGMVISTLREMPGGHAIIGDALATKDAEGYAWLNNLLYGSEGEIQLLYTILLSAVPEGLEGVARAFTTKNAFGETLLADLTRRFTEEPVADSAYSLSMLRLAMKLSQDALNQMPDSSVRRDLERDLQKLQAAFPAIEQRLTGRMQEHTAHLIGTQPHHVSLQNREYEYLVAYQQCRNINIRAQDAYVVMQRAYAERDEGRSNVPAAERRVKQALAHYEQLLVEGYDAEAKLELAMEDMKKHPNPQSPQEIEDRREAFLQALGQLQDNNAALREAQTELTAARRSLAEVQEMDLTLPPRPPEIAAQLEQNVVDARVAYMQLDEQYHDALHNLDAARGRLDEVRERIQGVATAPVAREEESPYVPFDFGDAAPPPPPPPPPPEIEYMPFSPRDASAPDSAAGGAAPADDTPSTAPGMR